MSLELEAVCECRASKWGPCYTCLRAENAGLKLNVEQLRAALTKAEGERDRLREALESIKSRTIDWIAEERARAALAQPPKPAPAEGETR